MNVVQAALPGRGRRDREEVVPPEGEEPAGAPQAATASATVASPETAHPGIALQGIALPKIGPSGIDLPGIGLTGISRTWISLTEIRLQSVVPQATVASATTVRGQTDREPTVSRLVDRAINDSERIGVPPFAAGMVKGRDPMTGDVPVVPMTSVLGEMSDPHRGTAPAVFVRTVLLIDVIPEMKGVSHLKDAVSARHRQIVTVPHHVERQERQAPPNHRLTI